MSDDELEATFKAWRNTELDSYLIDITADILGYKDEDGSRLWINLDTAGKKAPVNGRESMPLISVFR